MGNTRFGWHSGKVICKELETKGDLTVDGDLNFGDATTDTLTCTGAFVANSTAAFNGATVTLGDAVTDTVIYKGRIATGSAAGAALSLGSTYTYGEGIELRYAVTDWTGIGSSFKALYMRSEASLGGAYGIRGAEFYGVMNTSTTTGLSNLQTIYSEMLVKASASNRTLTGGNSIEANISIENQTGTLTLTNNIYCLHAKAQTGTGIADYTKVNGIKISGRDDGTARVFGIGLDISDPEATVCSWTKGISISTATTTGISVSGSATDAIKIQTGTYTAGINVGGTLTTGITIGAAGTGIALTGATTTGINITGNATDAIKISTGTITNAINVDVGIVDVATRVFCSGAPAGYTVPCLSVGVYGTPVVDTAVIDNIAFTVNMSTATNKTSADTSCMAAYFGVSNTAATTNNKLQAILASTAIAGNVYDAYAVQGHIGINQNMATQNSNAHITGISGKATIASGMTASQGWVTAGLFIIDGAGSVTQMCYGVSIVAETGVTACQGLLQLYTDAAVADAIVVSGAANLTHVFNFSTASGCISASKLTGGTAQYLKMLINSVEYTVEATCS